MIEVSLTLFSNIILVYLIWRRVFIRKSCSTQRNSRPSTGKLVLFANLGMSRAHPLAVRVEQTTRWSIPLTTAVEVFYYKRVKRSFVVVWSVFFLCHSSYEFRCIILNKIYVKSENIYLYILFTISLCHMILHRIKSQIKIKLLTAFVYRSLWVKYANM